MVRRPQSPQEKKRLALERDRVDAWGESQESARKNLPLKRARIERAFRHRVKRELRHGEDAEPGKFRRRSWSKWAGTKLGEHIERQHERRARLQEQPRRTDEARRRRAARKAN